MSKNRSAARVDACASAIRFQPNDVSRLLADYRRRRRDPRDQINREFANAREDTLHVRENTAHFRRRLSGKKTGSNRGDVLLMDRDIFQEIQRSTWAGLWVRFTGRRGPSVIRRKYPVHVNLWSHIALRDRIRLEQGDTCKTLWVPSWKNTGPRLKLLSWCMALRLSKGTAFNLHLTRDVIHAARNHSRGFAYAIQQRMQHHLRIELGRLGLEAPDFFFVVEATQGIEEHLHGAIDIPDHPDARKAVRAALLAAAGFASWKLTGTELRFKDMTYPPGWAEYCLKWVGQTGIALDNSVIAATNGLRTRGEDWYRHARDSDDVIDPRGHGLSSLI